MDYSTFLEEIKKNKQVWLLTAYEGAFAMFEDNAGQEYIPVWLDKETAGSYIKEEWDGYQVEKMPLWELKEWLNELINDRIKLAILTSEKSTSIPVSPEELKADLADK